METGNLHFKIILQVITVLATFGTTNLIRRINKGSSTPPSADLLKPLPIFSNVRKLKCGEKNKNKGDERIICFVNKQDWVLSSFDFSSAK